MSTPHVRVYVYRNCGTCRKALAFLNERGIPHDIVPIREEPPSLTELARMRQLTGSLRRLFNSSGNDYKAMNLATRLPDLTETEALELLSKNGNLVKRPFLLLPNGKGTTGFKEAQWGALFS